MQDESPLFSLSLDSSTKSQLAGAALWARILAIAGLLMLFLALTRTVYSLYLVSRYDFGQTFFTSERIGSIAGYLIIFVIPAFAFIFILRFSSKLKMALNTEDQTTLNVSFQNLKVYFRYMSILIIIFLGIIGITWFIQLAKGY